ncbi:MAG: hypothetical protein IJU76_09905 [Desulfovibrionaceae bacterium]|nr:hypothetical protein [Desulfovibrionaceae bacterium]
MTRALDQDGVDAIILGTKDEEALEINKKDRQYLRREKEGVLHDEESTMILDILSASISGKEDGWRFSDGSVEFVAPMVDDEFLKRIKNGEITFSAGSSIEARVRAIQSRPNMRLKTERSIVRVLNFFSPKK